MNRRGFIRRLGLVATTAAVAPSLLADGLQPYPSNVPQPDPLPLNVHPRGTSEFSLRAYVPRLHPLRRVDPRPLLLAMSERHRVLLLRGYEVYRGVASEGGWNVRGGHEPLYWCTHAVCVNEPGQEPMVVKDRENNARELYAEIAAAFPDWWSVDPMRLLTSAVRR